MDWKHVPLVESFRAFKARMNLYLEDINLTDEAKKATKIKIAVGDEGMRRILTSGLSEADQKQPTKLWNLFEQQVDTSLSVNFRVHRLEFAQLRQKPTENITEYVSRLRAKASQCDFSADELNERLIEMVTLSTPHEAFRKDILTKDKGTGMDEILQLGRQYEAIIASNVSLQSLNLSSPNVDAIQRKPRPCGNCGTVHKRRECPAYNDECRACKKMGHWQKYCRSTKQRQRSQSRNTHRRTRRAPSRPRTTQHKQDEVVHHTQDTSTDYVMPFHSIVMSDSVLHTDACQSEILTELIISKTAPPVCGPIKVKVDTGSGANTLPIRTYRQMFPHTPISAIVTPEPDVHLMAYSGNTIKCVGSITFDLQKRKDREAVQTKFYVVDVSGPVIIGLPTCKSLDLIRVNVDEIHKQQHKHTFNSISDVMAMFPDRFDAIGKFEGEENLILHPDSTPHVDAPRKCPIHLKDKILDELKRMTEQQIIKPVDYHTDWCSSITYAIKKDGSLRICLDPKWLNKALKRCPHKIPTVEELNPQLAHAKFFSKLDAKAGYWSVCLSKTSQDLTTFRTPFGRYCFQRLPFGLSTSQDIFQKRMDRIISQSEGCIGISDDIIVHGSTEAEHDSRLKSFLETARKEGLTLNSQKCKIKQQEITFFGRKYTKDGIFPDPGKVEDILKMETPKDKQDLRTFLGMTTYLSDHIPKFSEKTATLRSLLKQDSVFLWDKQYDEAFTNLKKEMSRAVELKYYNPAEATTVEVDGSMKGLGAALIQNGRPVAFASKALTQTEANYSNIERECLAVIHGIHRFHNYLYGSNFQVVSDHKPLQSIFNKPLHAAPPRLQRMLLKVQGYNFDVSYRPGHTMTLADTLSRLPNMENTAQLNLPCHVDNINMDLMNFSHDKQHQLKADTASDQTLRLLSQVIFEGWPNEIKSVDPKVREYWNHRDELALQDGIIFKGRRVVIPPTLREDILKQLHYGHQGIEKTRLLAKEHVFWPRINKDIEEVCTSCQPCQHLQRQQPKEPIICQERPAAPWVKLGTDLFEIEGRHFLIIADYFSRYPVVHPVTNTTTETIIRKTKETFSLFGVPREIVSDNGPQFQRQYNTFCSSWGIQHTTSSPRYPRSNGFIERQIGYLKPILKKCLMRGENTDLALLNVRATPLDSKSPSPAELLLGRPISTTLPAYVTIQRHNAAHKERMGERQEKDVAYANAHTKALRELTPQQPVQVLDSASKTWFPATITQNLGNRSYNVRTDNGTILRRNRQQIRPRNSGPQPIPESALAAPPTPMTEPTIRNSRPHHVPEPPTSAPEPEIAPATPDMPPSILKQATTRTGRIIKRPVRFRDV